MKEKKNMMPIFEKLMNNFFISYDFFFLFAPYYTMEYCLSQWESTKKRKIMLNPLGRKKFLCFNCIKIDSRKPLKRVKVSFSKPIRQV